MLAGTVATRERVLVAGFEGDEHPLELQMMHDQIAAAGYRTTLEHASSAKELCVAVERQRPDLILLGALPPAPGPELERVVEELCGRYAEIPVVLAGIAADGEIPREHAGARVLERIDESLTAVEELLAERDPAASR